MKKVVSFRSFFSLIELLVLVAILGIMSSLLMPSLRSVMSQAEVLNCKQQLHQLMGVTSVYLSDASEGILIYSATPQPGNPWANWISYPVTFARAGYFEAETVNHQRYKKVPTAENPFYCPSHPVLASSHFTTKAHDSYGINVWGMSKNQTGINSGFQVSNPPNDVYFKAVGVPNPESHMLFADSFSNWAWNTYGTIKQHNILNPWSGRSFWLKHKGYTANAMYLDGHVELVDLEILRDQVHTGLPGAVLGENGDNL